MKLKCNRESSTTHEFEVGLDTGQDEADVARRHEVAPFLLAFRLGEIGKMKHPVDPSRFCVSVVNDIVDMSYVVLD